MTASIFLYCVLAGAIYMILFRDILKFPGYINLYSIPAVSEVLRLKAENRAILEKYFPYYNQLSDKDKKFFEKRVVNFINVKTFVPRQMPKVTLEMKMFISASAIQLTFGLPNVYLSHFRYILVYPDDYYSQITKRYHKGEVNPRHKAIVLSWKSYVAGYFEDEGLNLGLHEMAHALHLENAIRNEEFDFLPKEGLKKWDELALNEIEKINDGASDFFRNYAATDRFEFFAVAIENFFERPEAFFAYNSELYEALASVLNQDPVKLAA